MSFTDKIWGNQRNTGKPNICNKEKGKDGMETFWENEIFGNRTHKGKVEIYHFKKGHEHKNK